MVTISCLLTVSVLLFGVYETFTGWGSASIYTPRKKVPRA